MPDEKKESPVVYEATNLRIKEPEKELPPQNRKTRRKVAAIIKSVQRKHDRKNRT